MKFRHFLIWIPLIIGITAISWWIGQQTYSWLPPEAAAQSHLIDDTISFLVTLGAFIFLGVTAVMMYSVIFHRAAANDYTDGPHIEGNITLEVVWTVIPVLVVFWIAGYSYQAYQQMGIRGAMPGMHLHMPMGMRTAYAEPLVETVAEPTEEIEVDAKQWAWVFRYPNSNVTSTELHLPVNERVHLALTSEDVLHGFYVPAFRLKQDMVPNETIDFELTPTRSGTYKLTDSQYSGTYFATMQADVVVESREDYESWLAQAAQQNPTVAENQAANEYAVAEKNDFRNTWVTVAPAEPPVVNYHQ